MHKIAWLDLGDPGAFVYPSGPLERWQDHGLGLMRTILHQSKIDTDILSVRSLRNWSELPRMFSGYDMLLMNVRSYTFPLARTAATLFKEANPEGRVITGGMHATVALDEMLQEPVFDHICVGPGEGIIESLVRDPDSFSRVVEGKGIPSMDDWPIIDRQLWPNPHLPDFPWPLEPECGWGPGPVATMLTSKVCPWRCSFCNEASYISHAQRRSVESVIDEMLYLDRKFGPLGSVVIHDSMFFQNPRWLQHWLESYPSKTRAWPYWAAARSDTIRRWPEMFESLVRDTNWNTVSIGFESGSDRMLKVLNKECTVEDNLFTINLLNDIGDDYVRAGKEPPRFWANIMLGLPGESRKEAFATIALLKLMKYCIPSISYYAPYPGSALGQQLIAEGKSLMGQDSYHRNPSDRKLAGVDYDFYFDLRAGRYDTEVTAEAARLKVLANDLKPISTNRPASRFYLFSTNSGNRKLAYGESAIEARSTLEFRLTSSEVNDLSLDSVELRQRDLPENYDELG
jgi:hypothetical protein